MNAVHFGAGNIGRGFIGWMLSRSGYDVTFVDVNDQVVNALDTQKQYPVRLASEQESQEWVQGVSAIHGNDLEAVAQAIATTDLVTTAIGVSVLPHIAAVLAEGIRQRLKTDA